MGKLRAFSHNKTRASKKHGRASHYRCRALATRSNRHECDTPLSQERLNEWAAFKQRYALFAESQQAPKPRLSLAGAQDKIPVIWRDETFYLPQGTAPSSHIVKFAVDGRDHVIFNELYLNTLAALVDIDCPSTSVRYAGRYPLLVVERYDRAWVNGSLQLIFQVYINFVIFFII